MYLGDAHSFEPVKKMELIAPFTESNLKYSKLRWGNWGRGDKTPKPDEFEEVHLGTEDISSGKGSYLEFDKDGNNILVFKGGPYKTPKTFVINLRSWTIEAFLIGSYYSVGIKENLMDTSNLENNSSSYSIEQKDAKAQVLARMFPEAKVGDYEWRDNYGGDWDIFDTKANRTIVSSYLKAKSISVSDDGEYIGFAGNERDNKTHVIIMEKYDVDDQLIDFNYEIILDIYIKNNADESFESVGFNSVALERYSSLNSVTVSMTSGKSYMWCLFCWEKGPPPMYVFPKGKIPSLNFDTDFGFVNPLTKIKTESNKVNAEIELVENGMIVKNSLDGQVIMALHANTDYLPFAYEAKTSTLLTCRKIETDPNNKRGLIEAWKIPEGELLFTTESIGCVTDRYRSFISSHKFTLSSDASRFAVINQKSDIRTREDLPTHKIVEIYSTSTGQKLGELGGFNEWVRSTVFSPDSSVLATGAWQSVNLWDAENGELIKTLGGGSDFMRNIVFSEDGSLLAAADSRIYLWNVESGELLFNTDEILYEPSFDISPNGELLAWADKKSLYLWNWQQEQLETIDSNIDYHKNFPPHFTSDGTKLIFSSYKETRIYDTDTYVLNYKLNYGGNRISISPDSRYFAITYLLPDYIYEGPEEAGLAQVSIINLETGDIIASVPHFGFMMDLGFNNESTEFFSIAWDGLLVYSLSSKRFVAKQGSFFERSYNGKEDVMSATFTIGDSFVITDSKGTLNFWSRLGSDYLFYNNMAYYTSSTVALNQDVWDITASPDGKKIVARGHDGYISLIKITNE